MENILQDQSSCHVLYKLISKLDTTLCGMMPNVFWIGQINLEVQFWESFKGQICCKIHDLYRMSSYAVIFEQVYRLIQGQSNPLRMVSEQCRVGIKLS